LTGSDAALGDQARRGIELAVDRSNASGGVLGKPVELLVFDSESSEGGTAAATKAALSDGAAVLLGEMSSPRTRTVAEHAASSGVPVFSPTAADPVVLDLERVHSMARYPAHSGRITGKFLVGQGWLELAGLAHPHWTVVWAGSLVLRAGGRLAAKQKCTRRRPSYRQELAVIEQAGPQVVVLVCDPTDAPGILRDARAVGLQAPLVAGPTWDHPSIIADPNADGLYIVTYFHPDDPAAADFVAAFLDRHGARPDGVAALAYDSATVAIDAIRRTRSIDPDRLNAALERDGRIALATGVPAWSRSRAPDMAVIRVSNGSTVFVERVSIR
jgi:branched-chain amino acid transport system substrate-binding protein